MVKKLLYPKTYAKLVKIIDKDNLGRRTNFTQHVYIYNVMGVADSPQKIVIEARYPRHSGYTPNRIKKVECVEKTGKKKYTYWAYKMVGEIFKLYQRPQDNDRWSYRYLGQ